MQTNDGFMRIYFSEAKVVPLGFGICADYMNKKTPKLIKEYVAVQKEMTTRELGFLDLAYAPPFASVWDVIAVALNKVK